MGLFDQLSRQDNPQQAFQNDLASLKSDPIQYAKAHGKSIPEGITDPNQMIQHLLKSTQVNNPCYQAAMQLLRSMASR